jgi:hypothetical protein
VIIEGRTENLKYFFSQLIELVDKKVTQDIIDQDLNILLPDKEFKKIRTSIKDAVRIFLFVERDNF